MNLSGLFHVSPQALVPRPPRMVTADYRQQAGRGSMAGPFVTGLQGRRMTAHLCEPFFLRGRRSYLERAILMSLVLAGLGLAAGWTTYFAVVGNGPDNFEGPMGFVWSLTSAFFVYGPLNRWNGRPWWVTLAQVPISFVSICWFSHWLEPLTVPGMHGTWEFVFGFFAVLIVNGALLARWTKPHLIAYVTFLAGGLIPIVIAIVIGSPDQVPVPLIRPDLRAAFVFAAIFGNWYVALLVCWGIPFWQAPEDRVADAA